MFQTRHLKARNCHSRGVRQRRVASIDKENQVKGPSRLRRSARISSKAVLPGSDCEADYGDETARRYTRRPETRVAAIPSYRKILGFRPARGCPPPAPPNQIFKSHGHRISQRTVTRLRRRTPTFEVPRGGRNAARIIAAPASPRLVEGCLYTANSIPVYSMPGNLFDIITAIFDYSLTRRRVACPR